MHRETRRKEQEHAEGRMRKAGYKVGGPVKDADEKSDKKLVIKGVHQHEGALHKGERKTKLKLKAGGKVEGKKAHHRLDRRARGGAMPVAKKPGHGNVNVILHTGAAHAEKMMAAQQGLKQGMQMGAAIGARQAAGHMQQMAHAPAGGPPPGGPPGAPGGMPSAPPTLGAGAPGQPPRPPMAPPGAAGMLKTGGIVKVREHHRRKAGGAVA